MLTGPVGPAGVAFLRICYPKAALLVIDRRGRPGRSSAVVDNLEAGADGYLTSPTLAEVASHVQALARRYTEYNRPVSAA
jgi:DNA-binding response OmpR family regulator